MPLTDLHETAIRNTLKKILPNLTEQQIQGVLRRYFKLVNEGHADDYSFITAIDRYNKHAKTPSI